MSMMFLRSTPGHLWLLCSRHRKASRRANRTILGRVLINLLAKAERHCRLVHKPRQDLTLVKFGARGLLRCKDIRFLIELLRLRTAARRRQLSLQERSERCLIMDFEWAGKADPLAGPQSPGLILIELKLRSHACGYDGSPKDTKRPGVRMSRKTNYL